MKIYKFLICGLLFAGGVFTSCDDDNPSIDDHPLNYQIPVINVDTDIPVGAYLYNPSGAFDDEIRWGRLTEEFDLSTSAGKVGPYVMPELGKYKLRADTAGALAVGQIVQWAKQAKIDFLITPAIREHSNALYPRNLNKDDSLMVDLLAGRVDTLPSINLGNMKYAISVDIENFSAGLSNNVLLETAPTHKLNVNGRDTLLTRENRLYSFIRRVSHYFNDPTYYHTNGRPVLIFTGPDKLYSENAKKVYDNIRDTIKAQTGKDVYIIARQPQWTPSPRFEYFFLQGKADAVSINNMCNLGGAMWDRVPLINQLINENFKYNKDYINKTHGIDFIPTASPSYTMYIANGEYNYPIVNKDPAEFRKRCNVAKMNLGRNKMVIIDSFNHYMYNSQIEPTDVNYGNGYGTTYLDIVADEFKVK